MSAHRPFWGRADCSDPNSCWEWTAAKNSAGYGVVGRGGRLHLAHRFAYEASVGPIPEGMTIDHLCRTRSCINPAHMEVVTRAENGRRGERVRLVRRGGNSRVA